MYTRLPAEESTIRIQRLQEMLRDHAYSGCLVTQNVAIYYLTGSMQTGYVYVPQQGEATYYVRRSVERAMKESVVRTVPLGAFRSFGQTLAAAYPEISRSGEPVRIATELDVLPAQLYLKLVAILNGNSEGRIELVDGSAILRRLRIVKSDYEIHRIEQAASVVAEALEASLGELREGITELAWIAGLERELRARGHIGLMRMRGYNQEIMTGMVGAGASAAEPSYFDGPAGGRGLGPAAPQSVSQSPIRTGEPILIDIGCCIDGYVIDQTRTAVIGELPADLAEAYDTAELIIRRISERIRPGVRPSTLYAEALSMAQGAGLGAHFMGFGADQVRFLGHGIGLEIDEWPVLAASFDEPLEPGTVLAVEPKFTFPGRGVVGIENCYLVTEEGARPLTRTPEQLIQIAP
ncbi:M24 family metallopeptidase [Paenibacillus daejeonensis]|uniref:M24 family metallopeptidase n=1 Tax=Paenibacillus daejeonensis TaxID=135193 RepID=UPI0003729F37|nr:Xaa-Pro peptidase family protein [Paenibacillus daejeonensis]